VSDSLASAMLGGAAMTRDDLARRCGDLDTRPAWW
jgi:hypothetical protein